MEKVVHPANSKYLNLLRFLDSLAREPETTMDELKVSEALQKFYGNEKLSDEAFNRSINWVYFGPLPIPFPNIPQRQKLVYLHDLNHLITGYDTSFVGEGEVAAFELASGFPLNCWVGYLYAPIAFVTGFFVNPIRVIKAFKRGLGKKNATHLGISPSDLTQISVGELKVKALGIS